MYQLVKLWGRGEWSLSMSVIVELDSAVHNSKYASQH
jgi:hypothetical protein